jgi:cystathionine beta-lyase
MKFNTKAIHGGQHPDQALGCNATHISNNDLCTNKPWTSYGEYEYSRTAKPTRTALENALASIEKRKRTGLFIWVSGNRLFDAGIETR